MILKELKEKRVALHAQLKEIASKVEGFDQSAYDKANSDYEALTKQIQALEMLEKREAEQIENYNNNVESRKELDNSQKSDSIYKRLLAFGYESLSSDEKEFVMSQRANVQNTTAATGGNLIPTGFYAKLITAMKYYMPLYDWATVISTPTGNELQIPTTNDTSVVAYQIAESTDLSTSATAVTFGQVSLGAWKWTSGLVVATKEVLLDSALPLEQILANLFAIRMGRGLGAAQTTGAGTTTISGIVTGAANSSISGVAATAITRDNILDLIHSIDPAYRVMPKFALMMNDSTLSAIRKLSYGTGDDRPLYQPSAMAGQPDMIEGVPVIINPHMASIGASAKSIICGDMSNYYIREVTGSEELIILRERYAELGQVGMAMLKRTDGKIINAGMNPIKYMVHAAS